MSWETLLITAMTIAEGVVLLLVKRYFKRKDERDEERSKKDNAMRAQVETGLETIRLLAYQRMSEEIERLLTKGYATPSERRILDEMYRNYKAHGWNGDMDERLKKVYALRTDCQKGG